ncbi:MAG: hypothetical protein MUE82_06730 [Chloroflexi bacterium]|jgi:DNA-binding NarL/FixJ family response regulator|nr:hypothetical protein [Chloroflexota bacterium]
MTARLPVPHPPTERQLVVLAAALTYGTDEAARLLCLAPQSVRNSVSVTLYRLGVNSRIEAAAMLGWLVIPLAYRYPGEVVRPSTSGVDKSTA